MVWTKVIKGRGGRRALLDLSFFGSDRPQSRWCKALQMSVGCFYIMYELTKHTFILLALRLLSKQGKRE